MTNKLEQNRKIIANQEAGATHYRPSNTSNYDALGFELRCLNDIRENIALQERVAELESTLTVTNKFLHQFTEVCRTGSIKVEGFQAQDKLDNMFREYVAGLDSIQKSETAKEVNNECN